MIAAVFDLDRTLLPGTTAERVFLRYLVRCRVLGLSAGIATLGFVLRSGWTDIVQEIRAQRPYLTGLHDARLRLLGRRCAHQELMPLLSRPGLTRLREHQGLGHRTILLSGSLPYIVEPIAAQVGIDDVICSQMETRELRLTGHLSGLHPYGEAKAHLMSTHGNAVGVDFAESFCYADHHTDAALLGLFGHPVCVNPTDQLRRIACERGWHIESFD